MLPTPSVESISVVLADEPVVVLFPEPEPPSVADAEESDPEALCDAVVFVPDCDLVLDADVALAVVEAEVWDAVFESLLSCLLTMALFSDVSGQGQACVSAEKDAMVARS